MTLTGPALAEREELFRSFGRAFFKKDVDALYRVVTPDFEWRGQDETGAPRLLASPEAIRAHFERQREIYSEQRFRDVVYQHLPEVSFMTFRLTETRRADGAVSEHQGVEVYTFKDGRIALKDVYRKPA
ncbi:MAG: nuclear transport factor 2 family protein [Hyphomicrobiaceae bacterium]